MPKIEIHKATYLSDVLVFLSGNKFIFTQITATLFSNCQPFLQTRSVHISQRAWTPAWAEKRLFYNPPQRTTEAVSALHFAVFIATAAYLNNALHHCGIDALLLRPLGLELVEGIRCCGSLHVWYRVMPIVGCLQLVAFFHFRFEWVFCICFSAARVCYSCTMSLKCVDSTSFYFWACYDRVFSLSIVVNVRAQANICCTEINTISLHPNYV